MRSRITIEVDFENQNKPIVQIIQEDSDDVRDKLLSSFLQSLGHTSRWVKIEYKGELPQNEFVAPYKRIWQLSPITIHELKREKALMESLMKANDSSLMDKMKDELDRHDVNNSL